MPTVITTAVRNALNNLGGGHPPSEDFTLGDFLFSLKPPQPENNSTTFVNSAAANASDFNAGTEAEPLATIEGMLNRFPDGFTGNHTAQIQGTGPYVIPSKHPVPGSGGSLTIVADRSAPVVSNAAPSFANPANLEASFQAAAFGAHAGLSAGDAWLELDLSSFGLPVEAYPVLDSVSPAINIAATFAPSQPAAVYPYTTVISCSDQGEGRNSVSPGNAISNVRGIRYVGFEFVNTGSVRAELEGFVTRGCKFTGTFNFRRGLYGGVTLSGNSPGLFGEVEVNSFAAGGNFGLAQGASVTLSGLVHEGTSMMLAEAGGTVRVTGPCDFLGSGVVFRYGVGTVIRLASSGAIWVAGPTGFFQPALGSTNSANALLESAGATVNGETSGDCVVLVNGSRAVDTEDDLSGNLTSSGGDEIVVGGNAGATFASLPANDLAAGTPQGCFAT